MAKRPEHIQVGPYGCRVLADVGALLATQLACGDRRVGSFSNHALTITIDPTMAPDMQAETLLHETLHAVLEAAGMPGGKHDVEEWLQHATPGLLGVLRANPALVAYLLAPDGA